MTLSKLKLRVLVLLPKRSRGQVLKCLGWQPQLHSTSTVINNPAKQLSPSKLKSSCCEVDLAAIVMHRGPSSWSSWSAAMIWPIGLSFIVLAGACNSVAAAAQFTASPTSGTAPLIVKFCAAAGIAIDFGDGTSSGMQAAAPRDCPGFSNSAFHMYTRAGIYHLRGGPCPSSALHPECGEAAEEASAVVITVKSP